MNAGNEQHEQQEGGPSTLQFRKPAHIHTIWLIFIIPRKLLLGQLLKRET